MQAEKTTADHVNHPLGLIQTMILVGNENYAFPNWHGALLAIASMAIAYIAVVYGSKALPYWQNAVFAVHILGFFAYLIPIWVNAPTATHKQVWTEFENFGGWSSLGLAALVGQLTGISGFAGLDAVSPDLRTLRVHVFVLTCRERLSTCRKRYEMLESRCLGR